MADIRDGDLIGRWHQKADTALDRKRAIDALKASNEKKLKEAAEKLNLPEWLINFCKTCEGSKLYYSNARGYYSYEQYMGRNGRIIDVNSKVKNYLTVGDII